MRRRIALFAVLAASIGAAFVPSARAGYFAGQPIVGPSADIRSIGGLDIARDGTGALVFTMRSEGVDHVFVSRLSSRGWLAPERVDVGLPLASSDPVVAASSGGRLAIAFVNGGAVWTVVRRNEQTGFTQPALLATVGSAPSVDMSVHGVGYVAFTAAGTSAADVRAARLDRGADAFSVVPGALDIDPANDAGVGNGRPRVAVAGDGIATVVWGEAGQVFARRVFDHRLSTAPQRVSVDALGGAPAGTADLPDIEAEDDSSYAWVVLRQVVGGFPRALARRLVGSAFDDPVVIDAGEGVTSLDIAMSGRGLGYAGVGGASGAAYGAVLKDDRFNPGTHLGGGAGVPSLPAAAIAETGDGLIAFQSPERAVYARPFDYQASTRSVTLPGPPVLLSRAELGPVRAELGLFADANRVGDVAVAFLQGTGADTHIVVASHDRVPSKFQARTYPTTWQRRSRPLLRWTEAFDLWGPVVYQIEIDGQVNGQTTDTELRVPARIPDGVHKWRIIAIDRQGQRRRTTAKTMRVDTTKPKASVRVDGERKANSTLTVHVRATDATGTKVPASGIDRIEVSFGDRSRAVEGKRVHHRYARAGSFVLRVIVRDRAGNATVVRRTLRIR